jgi:hypothetical protein
MATFTGFRRTRSRKRERSSTPGSVPVRARGPHAYGVPMRQPAVVVTSPQHPVLP